MKKNKLFGILFFVIISNIAFAGTKPVDGLPDYNGTYFGTPNTGSRYSSSNPIFTTLWRDNYYRKTASCAGEGCGKHPGIDISVPSGTPVKASLAGKVFRKVDCHDTWGGLVVIEANNPYVSGEKVYISYAHLRSVSAPAKDQFVTEGQVIGESGGATTDKCHGTSTGSHLHFQVDKPHSGNYPWYPAAGVESKDSDFEVVAKTYNPLTFIQGYGYHWTFGEDNFKELWGASNVNSYGVSGSSLWIDSESNNATVYRTGLNTPSCSYSNGYPCSRQVSIEASIYKRWVLNLDFKCYTNPVKIYFKNSNGIIGGLGFNYDSAHVYTLDMSKHSQWTGLITDLWIYPSYSCSASSGTKEFFLPQMYFLP